MGDEEDRQADCDFFCKTYTGFLYPIKFSLKQCFRVLVYPLHMTFELNGPLTMNRCP